MENAFGQSTTSDTFESVTRAAAAGGTTTMVDFVFQRPGTSSLQAIARVQQWASAQGSVDYGLHVIVTHLDDQALGDMKLAIRDEGVPSFKMFMGCPGVLMVDDAAIFRAMRRLGRRAA